MQTMHEVFSWDGSREEEWGGEIEEEGDEGENESKNKKRGREGEKMRKGKNE